MIPETTQKLLNVQDVDQNIHRLESEMKQLATQVSEVTQATERRRQALNRIRQQQDSAGTERNKAEQEMASREAKLKHFRKQAEMVTTQKELQAITHQIDGVSAEISALEERILGFLEQEERLQHELDEKSKIGERLDTEGAAQAERWTSLKNEKESLLKGLREDRITHLNLLDPQLRKTYEWLLAKHPGTPAVTTLVGESCGICGGIIVPHIAIEIRSGVNARQCPHCQRFLYARQ